MPDDDTTTLTSDRLRDAIRDMPACELHPYARQVALDRATVLIRWHMRRAAEIFAAATPAAVWGDGQPFPTFREAAQFVASLGRARGSRGATERMIQRASKLGDRRFGIRWTREAPAPQAPLELKPHDAPPFAAAVGVSPHQCIEAVAWGFHVTAADILSRTRREPAVTARLVSMYLIRRACPLFSLATIGSILRRDKSSVINGVREARARMAGDEALARRVADIEEQLARATASTPAA